MKALPSVKAHQARRDQTLHQDRQHVLAADEAAVEECETREGHQQHQRGARQHPGGVAGADGGDLFLLCEGGTGDRRDGDTDERREGAAKCDEHGSLRLASASPRDGR